MLCPERDSLMEKYRNGVVALGTAVMMLKSGKGTTEFDRLYRDSEDCRASVDVSKPANEGHFKTGQRSGTRITSVYTLERLCWQRLVLRESLGACARLIVVQAQVISFVGVGLPAARISAGQEFLPWLICGIDNPLLG